MNPFTQLAHTILDLVQIMHYIQTLLLLQLLIQQIINILLLMESGKRSYQEKKMQTLDLFICSVLVLFGLCRKG